MLKKIFSIVLIIVLFTAMTVHAKDDHEKVIKEFEMPVIHSQF